MEFQERPKDESDYHIAGKDLLNLELISKKTKAHCKGRITLDYPVTVLMNTTKDWEFLKNFDTPMTSEEGKSANTAVASSIFPFVIPLTPATSSSMEDKIILFSYCRLLGKIHFILSVQIRFDTSNHFPESSASCKLQSHTSQILVDMIKKVEPKKFSPIMEKIISVLPLENRLSFCRTWSFASIWECWYDNKLLAKPNESILCQTTLGMHPCVLDHKIGSFIYAIWIGFCPEELRCIFLLKGWTLWDISLNLTSRISVSGHVCSVSHPSFAEFLDQLTVSTSQNLTHWILTLWALIKFHAYIDSRERFRIDLSSESGLRQSSDCIEYVWRRTCRYVDISRFTISALNVSIKLQQEIWTKVYKILHLVRPELDIYSRATSTASVNFSDEAIPSTRRVPWSYMMSRFLSTLTLHENDCRKDDVVHIFVY